jgi:DNA polymerase elongation subunit (family B)
VREQFRPHGGRRNLITNSRILVIDIETFPALMWGWGMFKQNFGVEQIKEDPQIACVGYKWLGEKETYCLTNWEMSQKEMLTETLKLLEECDAAISKNGARFDIPWIRTELLKHKIGVMPKLTHIDLEKAARAYFRFHSNKLEYIVKYLDIGRKVENEGFGLWRKVMEGDPKARKRMVTYCKGDVIITERLYNEMGPHIENHPAIRALGSKACVFCGSTKTQQRGKRYTACYEIQRHQCKSCRKWFDGERTKVA